jgi:hypothetical protein
MIQKKRKRRAVLNRVAPSTGRQAFKGMIQPLLLGGGGSQTSPEVISQQYQQATAAVLTPSQPIEKLNIPCELTPTEKAFCDIDNYSWCEKTILSADDPKCVASTLKCAPSEKWKELWESTTPNDEFFPFAAAYLDEDGIRNGVDGKCIEEAIEEKRQEKENETIAEGKKEQELYENWLKTRGCRFQRADLTQSQIDAMIAKGINPVTTKTPCSYPQFVGKNVGDKVSIYGIEWSFLGWAPEQP